MSKLTVELCAIGQAINREEYVSAGAMPETLARATLVTFQAAAERIEALAASNDQRGTDLVTVIAQRDVAAARIEALEAALRAVKTVIGSVTQEDVLIKLDDVDDIIDAALAPERDKCARCGCELRGEAALLANGEVWCHPCADDHAPLRQSLAPEQNK